MKFQINCTSILPNPMHQLLMLCSAIVLALLFLRTDSRARTPYYQGCPLIYQRYSYQHTACQPPNPRCKIYSRGISKMEKDYIVWKHNYLRSLVAQGYERINNQPQAANMMQMVCIDCIDFWLEILRYSFLDWTICIMLLA